MLINQEREDYKPPPQKKPKQNTERKSAAFFFTHGQDLQPRSNLP